MAFCFSEEFNRKGEKLTQRKFDFCKTFLCAGFYRNPKELSLHHKGKVVLHLVNDTCYKRSNSTYVKAYGNLEKGLVKAKEHVEPLLYILPSLNTTSVFNQWIVTVFGHPNVKIPCFKNKENGVNILMQYGIAMNYLMAKVFHRPIHYTNVEERLNPDLFTDKGCEPWNVITKCDYYDDE